MNTASPDNGSKLYFPDGRIVEWGSNNTVYEYDANGNCITFKGNGSQISEISNSSGQKISISSFSKADWRRDKVVIPGPNGNSVYYLEWEKVVRPSVVYTTGEVPQNYPVSTPPQSWGSLNITDHYLRYIWLPTVDQKYFNASNWEYLPPGDLYPGMIGMGSAYEFDYRFSGTSKCGGAYATATNLGYLDYMRTPLGAEYLYIWELDPDNIGPYEEASILSHGGRVCRKTVEGTRAESRQWNFYYYDNGNADDTTIIVDPSGGSTTYHYVNKKSTYHLDTLAHTIEEHGNGQLQTKRVRTWAENYAYGMVPNWPGLSESSHNTYMKSETVYVRGTSGGQQSFTTSYVLDKNGRLVTKTEKDFSGTVKRVTQYSYYVPVSLATSTADHVNAWWNVHNTSLWPTNTSRRLDAVKRIVVNDGNNTAKAATEYTYNNPYNKGNLAFERHWDSVKASTLPAGSLTLSNSQEFEYVYDGYGNVTDIYEPSVTATNTAKLRTRISYDQTGSRVVKVETGYGTAEKRTALYEWYNNGAALWSVTDAENNVSTVYEYDNLGRQTSAVELASPLNGLRGTWTRYDDDSGLVTAMEDLYDFGESLTLGSSGLTRGYLWTSTHYDNRGNAYLIGHPDGNPMAFIPYQGVKTLTNETHINGGRVVTTTSPFRNFDFSDATLEWNCTQYDTQGRTVYVSTFTGSTRPANCSSPTNRTGMTQTVYTTGDEATTTDPAGKQRKQKTDAFGRLIEVTEDLGGVKYVTTYEYDTLGNMTKAIQGSQTRTFTYSSLGRLLTATNPESGKTTYTYYDSGDLKTKKDARNVTVTMTYDALRRIKTKTYSDSTPTVTYTYYTTASGTSPNIGRLKSVTAAGVATDLYTYNALGRVIHSSHTITGAGTKSFSYEWYLNGALKKQTYPAGKVVNYDVDYSGRTVKVYPDATTQSGATYYVDMTATMGITMPFAADGRIVKMNLGNGLYETRDYRPPGTPTVYQLGTVVNSGNRTQIEYSFSSTANNGNVQSQKILRPGVALPWQQNYTYDALNRLLSASESANGGSSWNRTYAYDRYGNRRVASSSGIATTGEPTSSGAFDTANNRLTGVTYDAAGNQTAYNGMTLAYDGEGRNKSVSGAVSATYSYDGEGRRVKKVSGGVTTYYIYDALGRLAVEYSTANPTVTGISYLFTDMLGSVRTITDSNGAVVECYDYMPFGRMLTSADNGRNAAGCYPSAPDPANSRAAQKFTGKERDAETGLDYFGARYMSSPEGRFMSPDPLMASARASNPQTWNRYTYALNNPLKFVDPTGLFESPAYDCEDGNDACLNDEQRRILENSIVRIGLKYYSGEDLWNAIGRNDKEREAIQNAFVNITDKLASISVDGGGSALSQIISLTDMKADRLYANVNAGLSGALDASSQFSHVSAGDHASYNNTSFKNQDGVLGNIQFSFDASHRGADIDIDIGNMSNGLLGGMIHTGEVLYNKITKTTTNQDIIRNILMRDPKIMITPSTNSGWNRR